MHSSALCINQINPALDNAVHFDFPAIRFQEGLVFFFGPFVCEADAHETQDFLPQVLLAVFAEKEVRRNQEPVTFQYAADFFKRLFRIRNNMERIRYHNDIEGIVRKA